MHLLWAPCWVSPCCCHPMVALMLSLCCWHHHQDMSTASPALQRDAAWLPARCEAAPRGVLLRATQLLVCPSDNRSVLSLRYLRIFITKSCICGISPKIPFQDLHIPSRTKHREEHLYTELSSPLVTDTLNNGTDYFDNHWIHKGFHCTAQRTVLPGGEASEREEHVPEPPSRTIARTLIGLWTCAVFHLALTGALIIFSFMINIKQVIFLMEFPNCVCLYVSLHHTQYSEIVSLFVFSHIHMFFLILQIGFLV